MANITLTRLTEADREQFILDVYCHGHMTLLLEMLRNEAGTCPRKELQEGLQQDLYDFIIKKTKELVFDELTDLLTEASWMSE